MASVKNKRFVEIFANYSNGNSQENCFHRYEAKIIDSDGDVVYYPSILIPASTTEENIDAVIIEKANPF